MLAKSADLFFIKILKRIEWKYVFWVLPSLNNDMLFKCCKAVCWTDFYFFKELNSKPELHARISLSTCLFLKSLVDIINLEHSYISFIVELIGSLAFDRTMTDKSIYFYLYN